MLLPGMTFGADESAERLNVYLGTSIFNNPVYDTVALVEFPFSLRRDEFTFFKPDSQDAFLYGRVFAQVSLIDTLGATVDSANTYFAMRVASEAEAALKDYRIFNKLSLFARPGVYAARLNVYDVVSKNKGEFFINRIMVPAPDKERLVISGVSLAYRIDYVGPTADTNFRLIKNGYRIYPNPIAIFSTEDTSLSAYHEVYNLLPSQTSGSALQLTYNILGKDSTFLGELGVRTNPGGDSSAIVVATFDIKDWPVGLYYLQIIALEQGSARSDTSVVPFGIIYPVGTSTTFAMPQFFDDPYERLLLSEKISLVDYLLTPTQKETMKALSDSGKINYLNQYWKEHDSNPSTEMIENRVDLVRRYEDANRMFSTDVKNYNGWSSDRGRIYLTYGPWEEIDEVSSPRVGNAYVVWYYRTLGEGKLFVFEDWSGNGDYRLVHSNVYGEVFSREWDDLLNQGPRLDIE
jgi:GWxTD domain-containing protein